jgi:hypothetical protein
VIEEPLRDWVCLVRECLSRTGGGLIFNSRETAINVSKFHESSTLVSVNNILKCSLRTTGEGGDFEVMWLFAIRGVGAMEGGAFPKGHVGLNCGMKT